MPTGSSYYSNWSPPAGSNETANGYFLERSHSARLTLEKACELMPEEEEDEEVAAAGNQQQQQQPVPQVRDGSNPIPKNK